MLINKLKDLRNGGDEEGFTLIELMIVVVIIGILAAIAIPIFANQQKSAVVAGVKSDIKNTTTNVVTALVKAPTAKVISADVAAGASGTDAGKLENATVVAPATTPLLATFNVVVSDSLTAIKVSGAWDGYTIKGTNTGVDTITAFSITYTSISGKAVQVGG